MKSRKQRRLRSELVLTGMNEEAKPSDYGKYDVHSDKIRIHDEPYMHFYTVFNKADARTFKKVLNELAMKHLGVKFPLAIRRGYQNEVYYDIYLHRWSVLKDGRLQEVDYDIKFKPEDWEAFKREVNQKLGKVYILK